MANYNYDFWSKEFEYKPGGAKSQQMIGKAIDASIEERRLMADRAEARRDRQLKRDILNYNYAQKMAQDMDDLNIMPTAGVQGMDEIMTAAGRNIADQAAYLNTELKRTGDMASYSAAMARLKSDVRSVKNMDQEAKAFLGAYNTALESGNLSDYTSPELIAMAEDMRRGSPNGKFENINGVTTWVGETVDGKPYKVAASQFGELKKRMQAKDDIDTLISSSIKLNRTASGNIIAFNENPKGVNGGIGPSAADAANDQLVDLINSAGPGNKERKSAAILVDHFGIPRDKAKALFTQVIDEDQLTPQEKADGIVTEGDRLLQQKWLNKAESMYGINQQAVSVEKRARQDQYEQYKEKLDNRRDVQNTINNLPAATINNNNENDPLSKVYMFKDEMQTNPAKFANDVKTSLIEKGFSNPKPLFTQQQEIWDPSNPNAVDGVVVIPSKFIGYEIVNEKLPANRRTPVQLYVDDFGNLDNVYKKIYAATGMESFGRKPIPATTKTGTNDPITEMQGIGQAQVNNDFAN